MQCGNEGGIYGLSIHIKCLPYQAFRLSATLSSCSRDERHLDNEQFLQKSTCKYCPPGWQRECYAGVGLPRRLTVQPRYYGALCGLFLHVNHQILLACFPLKHHMNEEDANTQDCCHFPWQYACHTETTLEF